MGSVVEHDAFIDERNDGYHALIPGLNRSGPIFKESRINGLKIHLPDTHDYKFTPGEELEIRTSSSYIPRRGICIKEYPYFYLFRSIPKNDKQEAFNFAVNKAALFSGIDRVEFKYPN